MPKPASLLEIARLFRATRGRRLSQRVRLVDPSRRAVVHARRDRFVPSGAHPMQLRASLRRRRPDRRSSSSTSSGTTTSDGGNRPPAGRSHATRRLDFGAAGLRRSSSSPSSGASTRRARRSRPSRGCTRRYASRECRCDVGISSRSLGRSASSSWTVCAQPQPHTRPIPRRGDARDLRRQPGRARPRPPHRGEWRGPRGRERQLRRARLAMTYRICASTGRSLTQLPTSA